jgi:hypothetical protein
MPRFRRSWQRSHAESDGQIPIPFRHAFKPLRFIWHAKERCSMLEIQLTGFQAFWSTKDGHAHLNCQSSEGWVLSMKLKKMAAAVIAICVSCMVLSGCSADSGKKKIGIIQQLQHEALDAAS